MKKYTQFELEDIINSQPNILPVPRLENRNFYEQDSETKEHSVHTYFLLVYEELTSQKINVSILGGSIARLYNNPQKLYIGWRREGDVLNLMAQLNLRAFTVDNDTLESVELLLSEDNCSNGLKTKRYSPIK